MGSVDSRVEDTLHWFSRIYLGGIPATINDASAFLSFICVLSGIEVLAGYRFGGETRNGERFTSVVCTYFPEQYRPLVNDMWRFRNSIVHSFSTGIFALTHHNSHAHLSKKDNVIVLNAEDFYAALLIAAQAYFTDVRSSPELQATLIRRLESPKGGGVTVGPIQFP